jgi:CheY-like chemotaxis protein
VRVLLVEDDDDMRMDLAELLRAEGFEVEVAAHGAEALAMLRTTDPPDVILLDLMMPTMDGWAFRAEQRADARLCAIPVLVLTAAALADIRELGAAAYLSKPIQLERLVAEVRKLSASR